MSNGSTTWTYTYNADGLRTKRTNGSTTYSYIYNGSSLSQMTVGSNTLYFAYDAAGMPMSVTYNGTNYYYATNLQGDVIAILNTAGTAVVRYTYDAWGKLLTTTGDLASTLGAHNPLRYRGYVYDTETQLYYLQSRYYNPAMGRFLNSDVFGATGQGLLGNNMFAYCGNNPVIREDAAGNAWETVWDIISLSSSVLEVVANPTDPWAWAGLIGDVVDVVIPCVGGLGEAVDAARSVVRVVQGADDIVDTAKTLQHTADVVDDVRSATGAYVVLYESGQHYIGKGGFGRAIISAEEHMTEANKVSAIIWTPTSSTKGAFITEYLAQSVYGVGKNVAINFNKIWSPGKKLFQTLQ